MYSKKVAAAIKVNGKILREQGDIVALPFGSEYSVLIKNLNSVRIQVKVHVDGVDATDGTWIVISPNSSLELERFIKNGNWSAGNRFKFIERTAAIEEHRGIKVDDGLVRIEYQTEQKVEVETIKRTHYEYLPAPRPWWPYPYDRRKGRRWSDPITDRRRPTFSSGFTRSIRPTASGSSLSSSQLYKSTATTPTMDSSLSETSCFNSNSVFTAGVPPVNEAGITVEGSVSHQQFVSAAWFQTTGVTEVLVFHLKGKVGEIAVEQAVTVNHKPECKTCGKANKATNKFCAECGTALELV